MKKFQDKVVWITGSSSGIGEATAYEFAKEGAKLILTALEADLLEQVCKRCEELGSPAAKALPFDLSQKDQVAELAENAWNLF
ncbi:MAG: SDR family NAD(P)-dependent oxidoreductase, partial [Bacteroidaceae bacterium]|nr:SDR family NAD(P)-dependent oxidoreductase [Bacteroidaceae bacterium]